jgi:peptide/nickel transport system permease protein
MARYMLRRALGLLPMLLGIVLFSFILMKLAPGGPQAQFQGNKRIPPAQIDAWLKAWCLDRNPSPLSMLKEFGGWFGVLNCEKEGVDAFFTNEGGLNLLPSFLGGGTNGVIHGDLGWSTQYGRRVTDVILERVPATLILTSVALVLWVGIAILLGVYAAVHRYSVFDQAFTLASYFFLSLPAFWFGLMLIYIFAVWLHWVPTTGIVTAREWSSFNSAQYWIQFGHAPINAMVDIGRHLILPVTTIVLINVANDSRFVRASMLESLSQDYVRTANAKGLPGRVVVGKHALRNALLPVVTNVALEIPFLFGGAIITETIFSWPGMGRLSIEAVNARDYFVLMGLLLVGSTLILVANLVADVVYALVDPRIRLD